MTVEKSKIYEVSTLDKYEYKVRSEEIKALIAEGEFVEAVTIADTIDWRRVRSVMMLCTISDLYKINRRFQESKDILLMAYERHPGGRLIVYSLCELSIKMGEFVQAIEYYKEFVQIAPKDTGRYILQYKLYEAQDVSLEERIAVLEEFKKRDYREKWAYELAYLYHRVGLETKCVEECDEMVLWFGEGRYIIKALELKQLHQPLTPDQQDRYLLLKREKEMVDAGVEPEQQQEELSGQQEGNAKVTSFSEYTMPQEQEEEFRVKTVDVGQYNTINLQKELAESMKELLGEDVQDNNMQEPVETISDIQGIQEVPNEPFAAGAPNIQEEREVPSQPVPDIQNIHNIPEVLPQITPSSSAQPDIVQLGSGEAQSAVEEVFFEDNKEADVPSGDTKEIHPGRRIIYPTVAPTPHVTGYTAPKAPIPAPVSVTPPPVSAITMPSQRLRSAEAKPSGFEQMLSQEYDGQISLAVSEESQIEKQITGQMNITDVMAEWERMKRENQEKRSEEVRKRVQQHTGNMFSEFDEATKKGLLEQLEKAVVEAILKEGGQRVVSPEAFAASHISNVAASMQPTMQQPEIPTVTSAPSTQQPITEVPIQEEAQPAVMEAELPSVGLSVAEAVQPVEVPEELPMEFMEEEPAAKDGEAVDAVIDLETVLSEVTAPSAEKLVDMVEDANRLRPMSEEEKELFGRFTYNRKSKEQIIHAVDTMSMDPFTDNVIVTGEEGTGTLELAKSLVRIMQMSDSNFSGKVAKISGATLRKKNVKDTLSHLKDGALIIERATEMSSSTATDLKEVLSQESSGLLIIMEGRKDEMNIFLKKNHILLECFNTRVDIEALNDHALVEYAKQYAQELEYSIDELGILALHTRIADMQTSDHEVTIAEVKELVDDAIYFADKKNLGHLCDILMGKRYDEEDMIILREKDFMHY